MGDAVAEVVPFGRLIKTIVYPLCNKVESILKDCHLVLWSYAGGWRLNGLFFIWFDGAPTQFWLYGVEKDNVVFDPDMRRNALGNDYADAVVEVVPFGRLKKTIVYPLCNEVGSILKYCPVVLWSYAGRWRWNGLFFIWFYGASTQFWLYGVEKDNVVFDHDIRRKELGNDDDQYMNYRLRPKDANLSKQIRIRGISSTWFYLY